VPYCISCGNEVTEEMLFCPDCGTKVTIPRAGKKVDKIDSHTDSQTAGVRGLADSSSGRIKKGRLYKQWVAHAGLPADGFAPTRTSRGMLVSGDRNIRSLALMQVLLGICIGAGGTALAFLLT